MDDLDDPEPTASTSDQSSLNKVPDLGRVKTDKSSHSISKRRGILNYMLHAMQRKSQQNTRTTRASTDNGNGSGHEVSGSPSSTTPAGMSRKRSTTGSSHASDLNNGIPAGGLLHPNWAATSASRGVVMEGYLTQRGGGQQGALDFLSQPWERRYFTLTDAACLFIYRTRQDFRNDHKAPIFTRPLRLEDYFIEVNNYDYEARDENDTVDRGSVVALAQHKALFAVNKLTVPDDSDIKPNRFQMTLVLRENVEAAAAMARESVHVLQGDGEVGNPLRAKSLRMERYRDHWVLRCDTEEELQQWVGVMRELCPSCFDAF